MIHSNTATVTCNEKSLIFHIETALRANAKREPDFSRAVHLAQCALLTQRERFAHEEHCDTCRADQGLIQ